MKVLLRCLAAALLWLPAMAALAQAGLSLPPAVPLQSTDNGQPGAPVQSGNRDYRLSPDDMIGIQVYQNPDLTVDARISDSGAITYPLLGSVQLSGLTIADAEKKIADGLRTGGFVNAPQVNIVLRQARGSQVSVLGEVARPGRFPLETRSTRVSDVLAAAGGITAAGGDTLIVTGQRDGKPFRRTIDIPTMLAQGKTGDDIVLDSGDTLYVPKAPVFYIYGEAQKPGQYRVERGMTVMQALAQGGGPTARGSQNRLKLERRDASGKTVTIDPRMTDPIEPGDVLYVGESIF
ncbi:MAG: Capsule polysaccharide export protein [Burkholderiaceae bacterium]|jgi:polysaccharide export outer membrane protein|nr:MAG: Capsule polysaccharide export protein [Burkholderiaceae bacterium]